MFQVLTRRNYLIVYLSIIAAMVCWSLSFIWYKGAYKYFGPITTIFLRLLISGILLGVLMKIIYNHVKLRKADFKLFFAAAFFEPFLYFTGESIGMKYVSPVTASVIVATIPLLTPLASKILFQEKLEKLGIFGIVFSFIGICLVSFSNDFHLAGSLKGVLLMFLAVFAAVGYAMVLRKLAPLYNPLVIVAIQNIIGVVLFAPLFFLFEFDMNYFFKIPFEAYLPVFYLAIFASSVAFILFAYAVAQIGVSRTNVFTNLIPILTAIFSYFMLNESLSPLKIGGIFIVVSGLFLSQWKIIKPFFR